MATSGNFYTPYMPNNFSKDGQRRLMLQWEAVQQEDDNSAMLYWTIFAQSPGSSLEHGVDVYNILLTLDEEVIYDSGDAPVTTYKNEIIAEGSTKIYYDSYGKRDIALSLSGYIHIVQDHMLTTASGSFTLNPNPIYTLSIDAGKNSSVVVNRVKCADTYKTGIITNGARLYFGDFLVITFTPDYGYYISESVVNGKSFASGNTYYGVNSDILIESAALPQSSVIDAENAEIEGVSQIAITQFDEDCVHSLYYDFLNASGTIAEKTASPTVQWTVPSSLYEQIPSSKSGVCTIRCDTYKDDTFLGSTTHDITLSVSENLSSPKVIGSVTDINDTTFGLTGDRSILIRYKSTAECRISSTALNHSSITEEQINGMPVSDSRLILEEVDRTTFNFQAKDTRGFISTDSVNLTETMIKYIPLTCNPVLYRMPLAGNSIAMTVSGNIFVGSFGAKANALTLQYRYAGNDGIASEWFTVSPELITYDYSSYRSATEIVLGENFNYEERYTFEIRAFDGADGYVLSTVNKTAPISKFIPVFNWGEDDFCFEVPVYIKGVELDYVVEQGTSDIWTYRKWNSGLAECWANFTETGINVSKNTLNGFYYSDSITTAYPAEVGFTEITYYNASGGSNNSMNFIRPFAQFLYGLKWCVVGMSDTLTNATVTVNLEAKGRWK